MVHEKVAFSSIRWKSVKLLWCDL